MRLVLLLLLALLAPATLAQTADEPGSGTSLDGLLRADGMLDVSRAAGAGALDLDGFDVSMTPDGLRAVPQAEARIENQ